ncbi:MAG: ABC transporter ATP-binding protein [Rhizobiaceae bacterium]|jgi:ABC-2 type transport system ATP-binding protein/lipopolysaccharide transport system ATP-binding protein|nr:ABC transporter ATP-binding protein [Rhizobiaceae bacterium]
MGRIVLDRVTVDIPIFDAGGRSLKNEVLRSVTGGKLKAHDSGVKIVRALHDVSLTLNHGARLGLIGHNGAGKSTLLRVMAGIYEPTGGSVTIEGEIASLFNIGFGMDADATGWDNIIIRGMMLGHSRREIAALAPEIGALSGLGEFLDVPIRTYSTGMKTRLAFAISSSIKPEILLIDEGIGTGDAGFLKQAQDRLHSFIGSAGVLVIATHSLQLLRTWCTEGVWLEHGKPILQGPIEEVLSAYNTSRHGSAGAKPGAGLKPGARPGTGKPAGKPENKPSGKAKTAKP